MSCKCKVCEQGRAVAAVKAKLSPEDAAIIEDLELREEMNSTEAGRLDAILRGTWPPVVQKLLDQASVLRSL